MGYSEWWKMRIPRKGSLAIKNLVLDPVLHSWLALVWGC
jgi:hypothetical protein